MATGRANITPHTINLYHCNNVQIGTSNIINYHESHIRDRRGSDVISDLEEDGFQASISQFNTIQSPAHFVGRQREIEDIKNFLRKEQHKRILQIYGPAMIGKKASAKRAISSINEEPSPWNHPTILIPCTRVTSWREFLSTFASYCKINIVFENLTERSYIVSFKDKIDKKRPVVLFTNCEKLKLTTPSCSKNFCDFLSDLLDNCRFSKFILTSQQYFELNGNSENIQLSKLSKTDSLALFEEMLPDNDNEIYSEVILDRCYGLPTYIRDAAFLVQDNTNDNPLTRDELRNLLEDEARTFRLRDALTSTTNLALAEYIPCIPPELHQDTLDLTILNGTFGLEAIQAVLGKSSGEACCWGIV